MLGCRVLWERGVTLNVFFEHFLSQRFLKTSRLILGDSLAVHPQVTFSGLRARKRAITWSMNVLNELDELRSLARSGE